MADRTNATGRRTATTAGILRPDELARHVSLRRLPAGPAVERWVENHWILTWDLPSLTRVPSQVLAHPTTNLTVERGHPRTGVDPDQVLLTGVATTRFDVELAGAGWVWGVRFRPGGLAALTGVAATGLTDQTLPAATLLPDTTVAGLGALGAGTPDDEAAVQVETALLHLDDGRRDPAYDEVLAVVREMLADRTLVRVDQVEQRCGVPRRRLQRLFAQYVGVGPKWVLARYRMHDVVTALDDGYAGSLADLAAEHGWYDQAHFAREFGVLVGVAPSEYRSGNPASAY